MYILQKAMRETMPQTPIFSSMLGTGCRGEVTPDTGERSGDPVYQDGNLISGSLEVLIQHLVPTMDYYPDRTYIFTFLLSSRVFIHPHELLAKVGHLCLKQKQQLETGVEADKGKLKAFVAKIIQLLKEWTETFPYDFQDEKSMKELKEIAHRITQCDEENGTVKKIISQMTQDLLMALAARNQYQEIREKFRQPVTDKGAVLKTKPQASQKDVLSVCCDPLVLAQQLTHIELERVSNIYPEDLMQIVSHVDSLDNHKRCYEDLQPRSLRQLVVKKKQRTRIVEFFIDVARECFNIGNFNSMMAIISGMNLSPVARLKKTWSKVKTAKFDVLEKFWEISRQIHDFVTWKQVECPFEKDRKIQSYLLTAPIYSEEALFIASFESEGPENHMEKDSWKTLRKS
ncbi:Ras-GEF domain-containing family member 1A [Ophiophagus hannah]|uniref:Ras-GEF domain-containing family member 1A n=1 Tax=Ophiophagus hannah TaxID=8665 RepID=V8P5U6_OPHHA|nr:Ras-GEF domain-containing family member 1A [Ophiophagus hannah]